MEIGKGLNHRLKACTDCLAAFRWLYVLRVSLNDRRKVEAEEALHVVIVESLVPRIKQTDVLCHTHLDSPPPSTKDLGILNAPLLGSHPDSASVFLHITVASLHRKSAPPSFLRIAARRLSSSSSSVDTG